jgi:hypothetical protein
LPWHKVAHNGGIPFVFFKKLNKKKQSPNRRKFAQSGHPVRKKLHAWKIFNFLVSSHDNDESPAGALLKMNISLKCTKYPDFTKTEQQGKRSKASAKKIFKKIKNSSRKILCVSN